MSRLTLNLQSSYIFLKVQWLPFSTLKCILIFMLYKKVLILFSQTCSYFINNENFPTDLICHLYYIVNSHMHTFLMFSIDLFLYSSINTIFFINKDLWWKSLAIILFSSLFPWLFHIFNLWDEISKQNVKV